MRIEAFSNSGIAEPDFSRTNKTFVTFKRMLWAIYRGLTLQE